VKLGRYEVKEKIASGGMASVYRAVQTGVGGFRSVVAIKILHPHLARDKQFKKMFMEEARIGALLKHRCLLNVMDYGEEEGVSYIVTEFFPSLSLEDLAERARKIPLAEALYVLAEAADGLHALHEARDINQKKRLGLVHRDISPHNILIGLDGRVKIIDYGIIKKHDATERTRAGIVKGKLRYMAPEQACGGPVSPQSDLYSLGIVFLRCITGQRPHGSGSTAEIMAKARVGVDYDTAAKKAKLPQSVKKLLARVLVPDAAGRYPSALELGADVRKALASLSQGYEVNSFRQWLEKNSAPPGKRGRRKRKKKKEEPRPATLETIGLVRTRVRGPGIHPKWVFYGLGILFILALAAHLLDKLIS